MPATLMQAYFTHYLYINLFQSEIGTALPRISRQAVDGFKLRDYRKAENNIRLLGDKDSNKKTHFS